ncbi:MAG: restriction endonuclease subunit S [Bacteroidota bacterium]
MKWKEYSLDELIHIKHGYAFKGEFFSEEPTDDILLTPGNFAIGGGFKAQKLKYYNGDFPVDYILDENDVIVTMTDLSKEADTLGFSAKVPAWYGKRFLHNQRIGLVKLKTDEFDQNYLYWLMRTFSYQRFVANGATGATVKHTSPTKICQYKFTAPEDKTTQRKIASILSAYDDLIENNLKRIKLLEEKAFASYKLIVQNEKLEEFTIEELANVVMGQSPTSDTYTNEKEDNLPFHQGVTNFSNYFVEHKIFCKTPIKIAEEGDILFSVRAPVGRINFTSDKICIGRGLCAFRSKKGFQNYLYHQLKEFFFAEDVIGNGAIFNAVTKVELMKVKLKTPSEKIQQEFELEAQQKFNLILNLTKQNTKLREARDILLPKLMNGQIEV